MCPREKGFVLWGHCQNLLDDPHTFDNYRAVNNEFMSSKSLL